MPYYGNLFMFDSLVHEIIHSQQLPALKNYAVLDLDNKVMFFGALNGVVIVFCLETFQVLSELTVISGKIYAISQIDDQEIIINGADGCLSLCQFNATTKSITKVGQGVLPESKQRWFASAKRWQEYVVIGDRMGGVHIFLHSTMELVKSFKKLHGRNGVTDIKCSRYIYFF